MKRDGDGIDDDDDALLLLLLLLMLMMRNRTNDFDAAFILMLPVQSSAMSVRRATN